MSWLWWGSEGVIVPILSQEEIESQCIHVWRDEVISETTITQKCIRCKKTRNIQIQ